MGSVCKSAGVGTGRFVECIFVGMSGDFTLLNKNSEG